MKVLLEALLPRIFPDLQFLCITHEGKQDLEISVPRKLRGWREPGAKFIILRDNDGGDCIQLKNRLKELCAGHSDTLIRIACQELEAWYLGEPEAIAEAFSMPRLRTLGEQARFRSPDRVQRPSDAMAELVPAFQKISSARRMAAHLTRNRNKSASFHALLNGIERLYYGIENPARPGQQLLLDEEEHLSD